MGSSSLSLPFKVGRFIIYRKVNVLYNMSTLIDISKELKIDFWEIPEHLESEHFSVLLVYYGYITWCKENYSRPRFNKDHALLWHRNMSLPERKKLAEMMIELFPQVKAMAEPKKKANSPLK